MSTLLGPSNEINQYGACWFACGQFTTQGYCLWPETSNCPGNGTVDDKEWNIRLESECGVGNGREGDTTTFGTVTYDPTWTVDCVCPLGMVVQMVLIPIS